MCQCNGSPEDCVLVPHPSGGARLICWQGPATLVPRQRDDDVHLTVALAQQQQTP